MVVWGDFGGGLVALQLLTIAEVALQAVRAAAAAWREDQTKLVLMA